MGTALWEFLWIVDKVTNEEGGRGYVFGGAPVTCAKIAGDLGLSVRAVQRDLLKLTRGGYIEIARRPLGLQIVVLKSKKRTKRSPKSDAICVASDRTESSRRYDTNKPSDTNICAPGSDGSVVSPRSHDMYKDITEDSTKDMTRPSLTLWGGKGGTRLLFEDIDALPEEKQAELAKKAVEEMARQPFSRNLLTWRDDHYVLSPTTGARTMCKMVMKQLMEREKAQPAILSTS
jgi:hypothetical protein